MIHDTAPFLLCAKYLSYNGNVCEKCIKCIRKTWDSRQLNKRLRRWYSGHIRKQTVAQHDGSGDKGEDIRTIVFVSKEGGSCMKEKKHWNRRVLSFLLTLAMVITQLGVWNAGKESVQAADTVIYQEDFSDSTDGWTPEWSVGSDLTTFGIGKNYAKDNDSSLNIWSRRHRYSRLRMRCQP